MANNNATVTVKWKINKLGIAIPYSISIPTYTGSTITGTFANYNSSLMTASGNTATSAGTHYTSFSIRDTTLFVYSSKVKLL